MKSNHRQSLGRVGESIAASYLVNKGYTLLERNIRTPYGEIDLIVGYNHTIVFVEVKTRASSSMGPPEISITARKGDHMRSAAEYYIQQHPEQNVDWRIDLITIQLQLKGASALIDHFENVLA